MPHHQVCPRCHAVWAVGAAPAVLCPRCGGQLSAPTTTSARPMVIPPPGRVRWVASAPPDATGSAPPPTRRSPDAASAMPTPAYPGNPGWGLSDLSHTDDLGPAPESAVDRWSSWAPALLLVTAALYAAAASAEFIRYLVLVYNRTHLIPMWVGVGSDALVWLTVPAAIVMAALAGIAAACRLVAERAAVFEVVDRSDPRSTRTLLLGCLVPIVNWVYPGVFLTEIDRAGAIPASHRFTATIRWWWGLWVLGWAMLIGQVLLRRQDGLQAVANGVLFSAITDLVAAAVATTTLLVFRSIRDEAIEGGPRRLRRWVISVEGDAMLDKPRPGAIAPIRGIDSRATEESEESSTGSAPGTGEESASNRSVAERA